MRSGVVAEKIGMSRFFDESGEHVPVTILKVTGCQVTAKRTAENDGYTALQVAAIPAKASRVKKPLRAYYEKLKIEPRRVLKEFRVSEDNLLDVGTELKADYFSVGQKVDVVSTSKGKGFAGAMKRHNFSGGRASHGNSVSHRSHGSTGQCQDPGRVFKGKKMAGQLGSKRVTIQNQEVVGVDTDQGLIFVRGSIPGHKGSIVQVKDSIKVKKV